MNTNPDTGSIYIGGKRYLTAKQFCIERGYSWESRYVYRLLKADRIDGAIFFNGRWLIPDTAVVEDRRIKTGRYINWRRRYQAQDEGGDEQGMI